MLRFNSINCKINDLCSQQLLQQSKMSKVHDVLTVTAINFKQQGNMNVC